MPALDSFLIDDDNLPSEIDMGYFMRYLVNPTNINRNYSYEKFLDENLLILDTRMNDMRIYRGKVPTLRAQRDGIYGVHCTRLPISHTITLSAHEYKFHPVPQIDLLNRVL